MKKSHFIRLLGYKPEMFFGILFLGGWMARSNIADLHQNERSFLHFGSESIVVYGIMVIYMAMMLIFKTHTSGVGLRKTLSDRPDTELEFFFTRAISRRSLFYTKSSRYLLVCLLPFIIVWVYSYQRPLVRIVLPHDTGNQARLEQFYLTHLHDSYLSSGLTDKEGNNLFLVLPQGQVNEAFFNLSFVCFAALLYQLIIFIFWGRWSVSAIFLLFIFFQSFSFIPLIQSIGSASFTPTLYDVVCVWVTQHPSLTLLLLGAFAIVTQLYCCRRYINMEITS